MTQPCHILPTSRRGANGAPLLLLPLLLGVPARAGAPPAEHAELTAALAGPLRAPPAGEDSTFILHFTRPGAADGQPLRWRLALHDGGGRLLREWHGGALWHDGAAQARLPWQTPPLPAGQYRLRLQASTGAGDGADRVDQSSPLSMGPAAPLQAGTPAPLPLRLPGLPYRIVWGNLHSQTGHSDGGGAPGQCHGAQPPGSSPLGPAAAYGFAAAHGLDFLLTSEHNHMYASAPNSGPAAVRARYRRGLQEAAAFMAGHPGFAALHGLEWGVISDGGHLNILNSPQLLGWQYDADGALLADRYTARGDYAALYTLMARQRWLGQFNHPNLRQFAIGGQPLAYHRAGAQAMALCEVMNSHAFSERLDEGEARHGFYEEACNRLLEAGYRLAFSSNQDNHCANWGASYGNRTGLLLPAGARVTPARVLAAVRARRVFASMDKQAAVALSADGQIMGSRFAHRGALTLRVHYASAAGRAPVSVAIMAGVPGRGGQVRPLPGVSGLRHVFTPAPGRHFYYARVVQDDGRLLWTAPVWVEQR